MTLAEQQIERIVREVLSRLGEATTDTRPTLAPASAAATEPGLLRVEASVVSLEAIERKLDGVKQLVVRRGAVITPAVRDLLREKQVTLTWQVATGNSAKSAAPKRKLVVGLADTKFCPASLVNKLSRQSFDIARLANTGLTAVTSELATEVARGGSLGVLLTGSPLAAACVANRTRGVRAAVAASVTEVKQALETLGVNLLVVDPRGHSAFSLERLVGEFASGGERTCPAALRAVLD